MITLNMIEKIRSIIRRKKSKQQSVDLGVQIGRREMLKGLAAIGVSTVAGLNTAGCNEEYDYRESFFRNFNVYDYAPFRLEEVKEWSEVEGYNNEDISACQQEMIDEELAINLPFNDLFESFFQNGKIVVRPKTTDAEAIRSILIQKGINADKVDVTSDQHSFNMKIAVGEISLELRLHYSIALSIEGTGKDGQIKNLNLNFGKKGFGVEVFCGPVKQYKNMKVIIGDKVKLFAPDNSRGTFDAERSSDFSYLEGGTDQKESQRKSIRISDPDSLIEFLKQCNSQHMAYIFGMCHTDSYQYKDMFPELVFTRGDFRNITMGKLREIFQLISDPQIMAGFMRFAIGYSKNDNGSDDEYRSPIDTLRSGWGDCDDYCVISYFWAYLHGFYPNLVGIHNTDEKMRHVFMTFVNNKKETVIMDNSGCIILPPGEPVESYIQSAWPGYILEFNEHV